MSVDWSRYPKIGAYSMREWLARKILWLAWWIDRDTRNVYQAGYFKFERGWQQPVMGEDRK